VLDDPGDPGNSVLQKIRNALPGWTVGLEADSFGRASNLLRITGPAGQSIQLGSGADTSNFLRSVGLLAATTGDDGSGNPTVVSTMPIGGTQLAEPIGATGSGAGLRTALANLTPVGGTGAFSINGVEITYKSTDSVNGIISRINASTAGVRAAWDTANDKLVLTNTVTGARQITLANVGVDEGGTTYTSNFLDAVGVMASTATLGQNAIYSVNGGADQASDTNTVTNAMPGVSLNLMRSQATQADPTAAAATPITININQDQDAAKRTLQVFVSAYNAVLDQIEKQTKYDAATKTGSALTGDTTVKVLERQLRTLVSSSAVGVTGKYQSLADIGVSTGKVGSAVGTTNRLSIDDAKLNAALADSPQAVETMVAGFLSAASGLTAGGNIASMKGTPTQVFEDGTYSVTQKADGTADVFFTNSFGKQYASKNVTFVPGVDNTAAIPGVTLTLAGVLTQRTDTFNVSVTNRGTITWFKAQVDGMLGVDGLFQSGEDSSSEASQAIDRRITAMEARLTEKEQTLNRRFAALESALAKVQSQSSGVLASLASLSSG
jgi:flagellar capping protein FliD